MRKSSFISVCLVVIAIVFISFKNSSEHDYTDVYETYLNKFTSRQNALLTDIKNADLNDTVAINKIRTGIEQTRADMKCMDFWMRYLEPLAYKSINGPLPVEWETEVFEKFEKPYRRVGSGLTLATQYLDEPGIEKDTLLQFIKTSLAATKVYAADSITDELKTYHHFYLCNRLFLLNLAAIYTTGFECPNTERVIPELKTMLAATGRTYDAVNKSFPATPLTIEYLELYNRLLSFVNTQPADIENFDHFSFIKNYINPLFIINQKMITDYKVVSHNMLDYSLNKKATSIFDKGLYNGQNAKGIFLRVQDSAALASIEQAGRLLFYDPILSGNNMRSCASCHKPAQYFTDTFPKTALQFNRKDALPRNSPSLVNSVYNHLVMLDGKHFTLQNQTKEVISNPIEMGCDEKEVVKKVLSCKEYKQVFKDLLKYTPQEKEITYDHIVSSITFYYSKFSNYYSPFDNAMNGNDKLTVTEKAGFNLFMSKAQCATCHFAPQFNGVKPPYIGSEFEVLGVPADTAFSRISPDEGRYLVNPAKETRNAFRTGSIRNAAHTMPYMHNGVFGTLEEVIDFYDAGGGAGRGLKVDNQTLSTDSLKLTKTEKHNLIAFIKTLDENIVFETPPTLLPKSKIKSLNTRKVSGEY
ncbi:MAG: hypothetical protein K9G49_05335 [Taibaiella sp.]|nr:hypothetical protein [Taibaiella sp.]